MATYKLYKKTSATAKEEVKFPASSIDGLATVATSGSYNDLSNKPTIPDTANNGTLTIQKNGATVETFTANQSSSVTANITVPTEASDVNALSLDGGTINKSKTIKMDASANSDGANLKWGTVNSKNPYIGYASDQTDGTFVVGSLLGTNYASGLAIGGGSGNLLWKGTKVATISDIPISIDGLSGGTLTSPLKVTGGDGANAPKISLDNSNNGQITDKSTATLLGFTDTTNFIVGHKNYGLRLRGKTTRPQYTTDNVNYYALALYSDMPDISGKLDKTKYEVNKTIDFGSSGALYVGKFKVYDTNVTCEVTSTTNVTYSGKLVIATQNYVISEAKVYGDATNTVAPNFFIKPSTTSDPYIEVYFKPSSWSKNVVHIYGSNIQAAPTDVCTNVPSVPSTATLKPKNALTFELSGTTLTITL